MHEMKQTLGAANGEDLEVGALKISPSTRTVRRDGEEISTTTSEFDLLLVLATRAGHVVTREELYRDLLGTEFDGMDRCIDVRVSRLRKKIGDQSRTPHLIKSIRNEGYLLVANPS